MADLQEFSKAQFDEAYKRALERKRLFKEYLARHQVMEKLNGAIEKLYDCERLPEDPLEFIAAQVTARPTGGAPTTGGQQPAGAAAQQGGTRSRLGSAKH